jgi:hypothetical protein
MYSQTVGDPGDCDLDQVNQASIVQTGQTDQSALHVRCAAAAAMGTFDQLSAHSRVTRLFTGSSEAGIHR